ncbi:uncharacterized protein A4U43_C02F1540 [Asparagus officinalis]|uniref:Uncharacterized protein n=1 Tax=Asparagus officinalis TaxID=4686 RepID=A0A5P1FEZ8_ASPOF|nr:uncharacterized protein LOC109829882 isoform X2 [Asparagus officinalis]ONK76946.1 uncharacterized protein A4U43_C02F1540 [Asparagus officinalis]
MRPLSSLGTGLTLVSSFLLLALLAELCYLLWWKKRTPNREISEKAEEEEEEEEEEESFKSPARELLYFFCWKKPNSLASSALNPQEIPNAPSNDAFINPFGGGGGEEEGMEAELMRLHSLSGPPRFLFTIKEETKEDLESDDGKSRRGRSLSDMLQVSDQTPPFLTPLSSPPFFTPPLTPNPLFDEVGNCNYYNNNRTVKSSPPPKFKFLRDAEEKLYMRTLREEATKTTHVPSSKGLEEEDGSFITIFIGKNPPSSSQNLASSHEQGI